MIKEAWLEKKSKHLGTWRSRWTILESQTSSNTNTTQLTLSTYKSSISKPEKSHNNQHPPQKQQPLCTECIDLSEYAFCQRIPNTTIFELKLKKNSQLPKTNKIRQLRHKNKNRKKSKSFLFRCSTFDERDEWCTVILTHSLYTTVLNSQYLKLQLISGFVHQQCIHPSNKKDHSNYLFFRSNLIIPQSILHWIEQYFIFIDDFYQNQTKFSDELLLNKKCTEFDEIMHKGNYKQAADYGQHLMIEYPFHPQSHRVYAISLLYIEEKVNAKKHIEIACMLAPFNAQYVLDYAGLMANHNSKIYRNSLERALQITQASIIYHKSNDDQFNEDEKTSLAVLTRLGEYYISCKNYSIAETYFKQVIHELSKTKDIQQEFYPNFFYAQCLQNQCKFSESMKYYEICLELQAKEAIYDYACMLYDWGIHMGKLDFQNGNGDENIMNAARNSKCHKIHSIFDKYITKYNLHYFFYFTFGKYLYYKEENINEAEIYFTKGLKYVSMEIHSIREIKEIGDFINGYACALFKERNFLSALQKFEKCILLDIKEAVYYRNCGNCCFRLKNYEQSEKYYLHAMEIDSKNTIKYYTDMLNAQKKYHKIEQIFKQYLAKDEPWELCAEYHFLYGCWLNQKQQRFKDAEIQYEIGFSLFIKYSSSSSLNREIAMHYNSYGCMLYKLNKCKLAIIQFQQSIKLQSSISIYYRNIADAYSKLKEYQIAKENFFIAMELDIENTIEWYIVMLNKIENVGDIELFIVGHLERNPYKAHYYIVYARWLFEEKRFKEAEYYALQSIQICTEKKDVLKCKQRYGQILRDLRRYKECLVQFEECLEIEPYNCDNYGYLATVHRNLGSYENAEYYYQKTFEMNPNSFTYYGSYGYLMYLTKQWKRAEIYIEQALKCYPDFYAYHYYYGLLLKYQKSDFNGAEVAFCCSLENCKSVKFGAEIAACNFEYGLLLFENLERVNESLEYFEKAVEIDIHQTSKYQKYYEQALLCVQEV